MSDRSGPTDQAPAVEDRRLPWVVVVLFFLGWVMLYANRTVLSPLLSVLEAEWGLSQAALGLVNSAFFLIYSVLQVPGGVLGDRIGRRRVLVVGSLFHGLGGLASGSAWAYLPFLAARALTGVGQSAYYATQYAIASVVLPAARRAFGFSLINSGMSFGTAAGWIVAAYVVHNLGWSWRTPFFVMGVATLLLTGLFARLVPAAPPAPEASRASSQATLREAVLHPRLWRLHLANFSLMYGFFMMLTWLPYLLQARGVPGGTAGLLSGLMPLAAVPAMILAGRLADVPALAQRLLVGLIPLAGMALLLVQSGTGLYLIAGLLLYGVSGKLVTDTLLLAEVTHSTASATRATVYSVFNFAGTLSMVIAPTVTGLLADLTGDFRLGFLLAAALHALALAAVTTLPTPAAASRDA